jgi:hypothetical protein
MPENALWNVEWPNVNASRKYPLAQNATMQDVSVDFVLPNDLIVDFILPVHASLDPDIDPTLFHVAQIGVFSAGVVISFGYDGEVFATVNVPSNGFSKYSTYVVTGTGQFLDSRGWVTIGGIEDTLRSAGAWSFNVAGGRIHPMCIRPDLRAVTSIVVIDSAGESRPVVGDIAFMAGSNFQFRVEKKEDYPDEFPPRLRDRIIFDAVDNSDLDDSCECNNIDETAPCVRTINGLPGDITGNIQLQPGSSCLEITGSGHTITIADKCSEPCCDCRELDVVIQAIETVTSQVFEIENAVAQLDREVSATRINLLASKTTGLPCPTG